MEQGFGERAQTATEYILLVALGLALVLLGIAVATQIQDFANNLMTRVSIERNSTISMLLR